jgi:hypothetical protein
MGLQSLICAQLNLTFTFFSHKCISHHTDRTHRHAPTSTEQDRPTQGTRTTTHTTPPPAPARRRGRDKTAAKRTHTHQPPAHTHLKASKCHPRASARSSPPHVHRPRELHRRGDLPRHHPNQHARHALRRECLPRPCRPRRLVVFRAAELVAAVLDRTSQQVHDPPGPNPPSVSKSSADTLMPFACARAYSNLFSATRPCPVRTFIYHYIRIRPSS